MQSPLKLNEMPAYYLFVVAGLLLAVYRLAASLISPYLSPLRRLPGPRSPSFIYGSVRDVYSGEVGAVFGKWFENYGKVIRISIFFGKNMLTTMDMRALRYVLTSSNYEKPTAARENLSKVVGPGVLVVEGEEHKKQRRVMDPAFGAAHIREMTGIFLDKAVQLHDVWMSEIAKSGEKATVDALDWTTKLTLDVIGLAGFGYDFEGLKPGEKPNELNEAFHTLFTSATTFRLMQFLQGSIPIMRLIRTERNRKVAESQGTIRRIARQLVDERKAQVLAEAGSKHSVDRKSVQGKDLLSLLVRANMASDLPVNQKMSDEDVIAQVPTFLVAGHETTATSLTWCMHAMCIDKLIQAKLRDELLQVPVDRPSMDQLMALPYLDAVCRETLRLYTPVPHGSRVALQDDVIPLDTPYVDKNGRTWTSIQIAKGDTVQMPVVAIHRSKEIWGDDASEFKPERWESLPPAVSQIPGVWGNVFAFLGGPHACIGYRFSVVEMKAALFVLVRSFEFELAVPQEDISKQSTVVTRPILRGGAPGLPVLIRPYNHA